METIATKEQPEPEQKVNWKSIRLEDWETPEAELEAEPEYKHLLAVCGELGLSL